ncbi:serine protease 33 [Anthonomus grandis grandis]|uniref:serine protease 33 n=1 Tax=Anthonomus grandis grandis TaxID=2921223 RepID=UPI002165EC8D|nr:serine protease 33 [Anthonomus grandis grandis]
MPKYVIFSLVLLIASEIDGVWSFWKWQSIGDLWKRKTLLEDGENKGFTGHVLVTYFGFPSHCELQGIPHSCTLSLACWWGGGSSQSGCGTTPWIVACCVTKKSSGFQRIVKKYEEPLELNNNNLMIQRRNNLMDIFTREECGLSNDRILQKRIVGGREADFGQFPWQAHIKILSYQCGGVLVSKRFVLTAAHCILPAKLSDLLVFLGELDTRDTGDVEELSPAELHRVRKRLIHPKYQFKLIQPDRYDLALLQLVTEAGHNFHISPICLPNPELKVTGRDGVVAGWGKTDPMSKQSGTNVLRSVKVPILDISECMAWHKLKQITLELHPEMICAGYQEGKRDACLGDSGGPLIVLEKGRWTLAGITSAGYGCGEANQPGIYQNIPTSVDWITKVINTRISE